jgi:lysophospholipase L1-like esterase
MSEPVPAAEANDPDVLSPAEEAELLAGATWDRFAVLGDSIAHGLREAIPGYQDLGWADRVAVALRRGGREVAYRNFGVPELRAAQVRESQLEPARRFAPDLALVVCGGNDLLVRKFDVAAVEHEIELILTGLQEAGADVITCTMLDMPRALAMPPEFGTELRDRFDALCDATRRAASRNRVLVAECAPLDVCADPGIYASDFQHANTRGHAIAASVAIRRLGAFLRERSEPAEAGTRAAGGT